MKLAWLIVTEASRAMRSAPGVTILTTLMIAGMVLAVMLTSGRTFGTEQKVLQSIDSTGSRTVIVRAQDGAGIRAEVLDRLASIQGVEWAGGFSAAIDATNAAIPDGNRVPVRYAYGTALTRLGVSPDADEREPTAYASAEALELLGMPDSSGVITVPGGESFSVGAAIAVPDYLRGLEPLVVVPRPRSASGDEVSLVLVIATQPNLVSAVASVTKSVLAADDQSKVTVQTSEGVAALRDIVQGQLTQFSRGLLISLLGLSGILITILLFALVMMRRKEYGRRRALGATRSLIISLLLTQTALQALTGVVVGSSVGQLILTIGHDPSPGPAFIFALGLLTVLVSVLAALLPALFASRRDPIAELRVP